MFELSVVIAELRILW